MAYKGAVLFLFYPSAIEKGTRGWHRQRAQ